MTGISGKTKHKDDALPASTPDPVGELQPGGGMFVKPRISYPGLKESGEKYSMEGVTPIAGVPVSGRSWKLEAKRKSSMMVPQNKMIRKKWDEKMAEKAIQKQIKQKEKALIQARIDEKHAKKKEIEERNKRKEANRLKSSVVQHVSTETVRRMSRKQLRSIRKMDVHSEINPAPIKKTKGNKGKVMV